MNQTRTFLLFAWLIVAMLLWMEWGKEQAAKSAPAANTPAPAAAPPSTVPAASRPAAGAPVAALPSALPSATPNAAPVAGAASPSGAPALLTVSSDVLRLKLDGGGVHQAELLRYPRSRDPGAAPVKLFDADPAHFYAAQSGWVAQDGQAPTHERGFVPQVAATTIALAPGQDRVSIPFLWQGADGVRILRTYTLTRGSYAIEVRDEVENAGAQPWRGHVYRQLVRVPPAIKSSMTNPESYSFHGAAWYSHDDGYTRHPFTKFLGDGTIDKDVTGGWLAMPQHHFFSAWIPQPDQGARYSLAQAGNVDTIVAQGPAFDLAPGQRGSTSARLWAGPKEVSAIKAQGVPGLERAVDYSRYSLFAVLGQGLFWILSQLHAIFRNWGWAIIGLVVLLKIALFPLSNAQYKSAAQMRRFQPRLQQLKERYGDDRQKFAQAQMELMRKEKINPMGGCLPIIPQILIFMTLYWVLSEAVELRQAPWIGWIHDLTARDPYLILPALNMAIMWATQHLTPTPPGLDPMQQKLMKAMPLVFGVVLAFLPAGLVLYQVANGGLGLLQQWYMIRKYADPQPAAVAK